MTENPSPARHSRSRVAIYIPAYNAAGTLPTVLDRIPAPVLQQVAQILIVDNASADETSEVARDYRERRGLDKIHIVTNDRNLGYGGSQKLAYRRLIEAGFDAVVMLHADGQYAPEEIEKLIEPLVADDADFVLGSRLAGNPLAGGMPLERYLGNKSLTWLTNLVLGWSLSEYHSGYRAYSCAALQTLPFERCADYYHFDVDILIQARIKRLRVIEVPISTHYGDEACYQNTWRTGVSILKTLAQYTLHRAGLQRSARFDVV